jgi:hypothetical protein
LLNLASNTLEEISQREPLVDKPFEGPFAEEVLRYVDISLVVKPYKPFVLP